MARIAIVVGNSVPDSFSDALGEAEGRCQDDESAKTVPDQNQVESSLKERQRK